MFVAQANKFLIDIEIKHICIENINLADEAIRFYKCNKISLSKGRFLVTSRNVGTTAIDIKFVSFQFNFSNK